MADRAEPAPRKRRPGAARSTEHARAARGAGLRYVADTEPGITRRGAGRGFAYYRPDGGLIRDRDTLRRVRSLAIPPAWTDVWICADPDGHLQATARDSKGRKQYRYHPRFRAARDESKFGRMLRFCEALPRLRERVERDLSRPGLPRDKVLAALVRLLDKTQIRVGSDEYARANRSYGLTTLKRRHVEISGAELRFQFRGKSGVLQSVALADRRIARIVQRCAELPGEELFQYLDADGVRQTVGSGDLNHYLRRAAGTDVTAKDFRTWAGTMRAATKLRDLGPARSEREARTKVVRALDEVAERLGNTRTVCRKYYVHPDVIDAYLSGEVVAAPAPASTQRRERPTAALRREEVAVLEFLRERQEDR